MVKVVPVSLLPSGAVIETNVLSVVQTGMCTGCGLCESVCPTGAIHVRLTNRGLYEPDINLDLCTHCTYCLTVCGRYELDYARLRKVASGTEGTFHRLLGRLISCYRGHAADKDLRWRATSGGTTTALLKLAFEIGMIDAAIVTRTDPFDPVMTQPFVARSFEEALSACGARYAPSPVNRCLREVRKNDRIAVVGLPCHFESLRKAEANRRELGRKIILRLGLFCSHNMSLLATEYVYRHFRVPRAEVANFKYRGDGWPGGIRVETVDGREFRMPNQGSLWTKMFMAFIFAAPYCLLCTDHTSEFADISCGDAWLPEVMKTENAGESVIITRTPIGERLINIGVERGDLEISGLSANRIVESQCWPLYFKKGLVHSKREMLAERRFDVGKDDTPSLDLTETAHWLVRRAWLNAVNSCRPFVPSLLSRLPSRLIEVYSNGYNRKLWQQSSIWLQEMRR